MLNYGMGITISAFDQVTHVVRSIEGVIKGLERTSGKTFGMTQQSLGKLAGGIAIAGAGMAGIGGTWNLAKQAADVERGLAGVHILTHAGKEEMAELEKFAKKTAAAMGFMPMEAIEGMHVLGTQGVKVGRMLQMLPQLMKFSRANKGLGMEQATAIATQAMASFALPQEYFERTLDQMQKAADMFKLNVQDLELGLARGTQGFMLSKARITDFLAIFGTIKDVVPSPMMAGTGSSYMIKELTDRKNRMQIKEKLGVDIIDGLGGFRMPPDILKDLWKQVQTMTTQEMTDFFSEVFNETGLNAIVSYFGRLQAGFEDDQKRMHKGIEGIDFAWQQLGGAYGTVNAAYEEMMETFTGQTEVAAARWMAFKEILGKPMAAAWRPFVEAWNAGIVGLTEIFEKLSPEVQNTIGSLAVWGSILAVIVGIGGTIIALWPLLADVFGIMAGGIGAFVVATWPVLLALGLIWGLYQLISNNVAGLGDAWTEATQGISAAWNGFLDTISTVFGSIWDGIKEGFEAFGSVMSIFDFLRAALRYAGEALVAFFGLFDSNADSGRVFRVIGRAIGFLAATVMFIITNLTAGFVGFAGIIVNIIGWIADKVGFFINTIGRFFKDFAATKLGKWLGMGTTVVKEESPGENKIDELWGKPAPNQSVDKMMTAPPDQSRNAMSMSDFVPLSKMTVPVSDRTSGYYEGVVPAGSEAKDPIDYNKLAEACAKQPINCVFDGDKIVGYFERARERRNNLESR